MNRIVLAGLLLSSLATAASACDAWDLSGPFSLQQSNRLTVTGEFHQSGDRLQGTASFFSPTLGDHGTRLDGKLTGVIDGEHIHFEVAWYGNYVTCSGECVGSSYDGGGAYDGSIGADGRISGLNWDLTRPAQKVGWSGKATASCRPVQSALLRPIRKLPGPGSASGPACRPGFVWREARPGDLVCVPPASRERVRRENAGAAGRRDPFGRYGRDSCIRGYVWREAFGGDRVCVTPEVRDLTQDENALAASRRQ
jgi:hypothetical protein